jgi:hypothetical protein
MINVSYFLSEDSRMCGKCWGFIVWFFITTKFVNYYEEEKGCEEFV